jgi:uncharacterized C2H2 Zn-finger protein
VSCLGVLIDRLEYADDAALIDADAEQASERVSRLCAGALRDADMEISAPKSEIMFVRPRVDTGKITAEAYGAAELKELAVSLDFKCKHCQRGFDTWNGCRIHETRHCEVARVELTEEVFEAEQVLDARGSPDRRFYCVKWKGYTETTWAHRRRLQCAELAIKDFWESGVLPDSEAVVEAAGEFRCPDCNTWFKRHASLKRHFTIGCKLAVASRKGTRAEKAVAKARQMAIQSLAGTVMMGDKRLLNVFTFKYLGFLFQADGDRLPAMQQRMAIARTRFGELHEAWRSTKMPTSMKLRIFACAVVSVLTYGNEIWRMGEKTKRTLRGWCARCLSVMTGRLMRNETVEPSFDLVSRLRSRRLRWAGHILRLEEASLKRRVLLATVQRDLEQGNSEEGGLLADAPVYSTVAELLELAADRVGWQKAVRELLPSSDPTVTKKGKKKAAAEGSSGVGLGADGKLQQVI